MLKRILPIIIILFLVGLFTACSTPDPREAQQKMRQNAAPPPVPSNETPAPKPKNSGGGSTVQVSHDMPQGASQQPDEPAGEDTPVEEETPAEPEPEPDPVDDTNPFDEGANEESTDEADGQPMTEKVREYNIFLEQFSTGFKAEDLLVKLSGDFRANEDYRIFGAVDGLKFFPYRLLTDREDYCLVLRYETLEDLKLALTKTVPAFFKETEREFDKSDFILKGNFVLYLNGEFEDFRRKRLKNVFVQIIEENKNN